MAELFSSQNRSGVLQGNLSLFLCHAAPLVTFRGLRHPFRKFVSWYNPLRSGQAETRGDFQPLQHHIQVQKNRPKSKIEPIFRYSDPTLCEAGLNAAENKIFEITFQFLDRSVYSDLDNSSSRRSNLRLSRFLVCTCFFQDFEKMIRKSRSLLIKTEVYLLFIEKNRGNLI